MKNEWWKHKAIELLEAADSHNLKHFYYGYEVVFGPRVKETALLYSVNVEIICEQKQI